MTLNPTVAQRQVRAGHANRFTVAIVTVLAMTALTTPSAHAAPFVPAHDDVIVERLPARLDASQRARRAELARDPRQLPLALATSQQAIARARRDGDPRELGVAQAALSPWWREAKAPAPVRLLRATILQSRHEFAAAQTDLDALVADANAPVGMRAQALLTRASLQQLRGRFDSARTDCEALRQPEFVALGHAVERTAKACLIELQSLTGDPRLARLELDALASSSTSDPINGASIDPWLNLLRAELAERLGDDAAAQRHYQAASRGGDVYALAGFTDWLLERGRAREALAVLDGGPEQADALLLRRAIAWQQLGDARAKPTAAKLRERFAAIRMRGDSPHLREEALLALHIDGDATRALALARQQWALQKEPADAVLLWRAASAGADGASSAAGVARELRGWLPDPPRADVRLASMRKSTGGSP